MFLCKQIETRVSEDYVLSRGNVPGTPKLLCFIPVSLNGGLLRYISQQQKSPVFRLNLLQLTIS